MGIKPKQQRKQLIDFLISSLDIESCSPQITEALRRYGVSDDSTALLVVRIDPIESSQVKSKMSAVVEGTQVPLSELAELTDWVAVKKVGVIICVV